MRTKVKKFVFLDSLHFYLRKYRILQVIILAFLAWLTYDMHIYYKSIALELQEWQVVPILGYLGTMTAGIFAFLNDLSKRHEMDEADEGMNRDDEQDSRINNLEEKVQKLLGHNDG